jgi:RNA polymerase sigma-70 factor (ECF subfamily)
MFRHDAEADFVTLALEQYQTRLIRYATSILGDIERAREVVQDTFLKLCKERPARLQDHLAPWLFAVCRNRAFDVRRKDERARPLTSVDLETRPAPGPRPLAQLEQQETLRQVLDRVSALPDKEREVILLKFQCDLSYKEISAITGHSVSNVGFLIHSGMKRIRSEIRSTAPSPTPTLVRRLQ